MSLDGDHSARNVVPGSLYDDAGLLAPAPVDRGAPRAPPPASDNLRRVRTLTTELELNAVIVPALGGPVAAGGDGAEAPVAAGGGAPDQGTGEARRSGAGSRGSATFRPLRVLRRLPRFRAYPAG